MVYLYLVRVRAPMLVLAQLSNYLTQLSNYLTLKGSFSAVSKPHFARKYSLESSRRDVHNALLCTVLSNLNVFAKNRNKLSLENGAKECIL